MLIEKIKNNMCSEKEVSISDKIKEAKEKASNQEVTKKQEKTKNKSIEL